MAWDSDEQVVDLYFGEAKLYQNLGAALTAALTSLETFHANDMRRHECSMVTLHFKYADDQVRAVVADLLDNKVPDAGVRINHACLIGYSWDEYKELPRVASIAAIRQEFRNRHADGAPRLHRLLQGRLDTFKRKHLRPNVMFVPFRCVLPAVIDCPC